MLYIFYKQLIRYSSSLFRFQCYQHAIKETNLYELFLRKKILFIIFLDFISEFAIILQKFCEGSISKSKLQDVQNEAMVLLNSVITKCKKDRAFQSLAREQVNKTKIVLTRKRLTGGQEGPPSSPNVVSYC